MCMYVYFSCWASSPSPQRPQLMPVGSRERRVCWCWRRTPSQRPYRSTATSLWSSMLLGAVSVRLWLLSTPRLPRPYRREAPLWHWPKSTPPRNRSWRHSTESLATPPSSSSLGEVPLITTANARLAASSGGCWRRVNSPLTTPVRSAEGGPGITDEEEEGRQTTTTTTEENKNEKTRSRYRDSRKTEQKPTHYYYFILLALKTCFLSISYIRENVHLKAQTNVNTKKYKAKLWYPFEARKSE